MISIGISSKPTGFRELVDKLREFVFKFWFMKFVQSLPVFHRISRNSEFRQCNSASARNRRACRNHKPQSKAYPVKTNFLKRLKSPPANENLYERTYKTNGNLFFRRGRDLMTVKIGNLHKRTYKANENLFFTHRQLSRPLAKIEFSQVMRLSRPLVLQTFSQKIKKKSNLTS